MEGNSFNKDFDTDLGKKVLALTKASFKVSDLITDLVLREKIKSQVLDIYKLFFSVKGESVFSPLYQNSSESKWGNYNELLREIDVLDHLFLLAGHLELTKREHVKALRNGFLVFKSCIVLVMNKNNENDRSPAGQAGLEIERSFTKNSFRSQSGANKQLSNQENVITKQKKILEKFENKDTLKLSEIMELFPDTSEKTVRNELSVLVNSGKIIRSGWGGSSIYKLVK